MAETVFKVGDVVRLKSGGPKMTVKEVTTASVSGTEIVNVRCIWFHDNKVGVEVFQQDVLKEATDDATVPSAN